MSIKKARYDGPSGTGVDVRLSLPDGQERWVHVDHGHQLPTELDDGTVIPASERDRLLETDDWAEVSVATGDDVKPPADKPAVSTTTIKKGS